jgi:hypothetical protein
VTLSCARSFDQLLTCSQQPLSWISQSTLSHPIASISNLVFPSHRRLGLPNNLFNSGFPNKYCTHCSSPPYVPHAPPISTCEAPLWFAVSMNCTVTVRCYMYGVSLHTVLRSSMSLGATALISVVIGSAHPYRLLWTDLTCRAHIKRGGGCEVVYNAYLRRFSLTLVGA